MKMTTTARIFCAVVLMCVVGPQVANAQADIIDDPLKKPAIWMQLKGAPADSMLWARYIAKPWATLTRKEAEQLVRWRESLMEVIGEIVVQNKHDRVDWTERQVSTNPDGTPVVDDVTREQEKLDKELAEYMIHLEKSVVKESNEMQTLKSNLNTNFMIIESLYADEFKEFGKEYKNYASVHPGGGYPKQQWIEDKERELRVLKQEKFIKMKEAILRAHGKG